MVRVIVVLVEVTAGLQMVLVVVGLKITSAIRLGRQEGRVMEQEIMEVRAVAIRIRVVVVVLEQLVRCPTVVMVFKIHFWERHIILEVVVEGHGRIIMRVVVVSEVVEVERRPHSHRVRVVVQH